VSRVEQAADDIDEEEELPKVYSTPEEVIERERSERAAKVIDKWYYKDRDEMALLMRYRLQGNDCDVILQLVLADGGYWAEGWPDKEKVPLYRAYEGLGKSPVFICQGEYAVDAAFAMGLAAVTSAGGVDDVEKSDWRPMAGREVVILPENSPGGRHFARAVARMVIPLDPPPQVRMLALPGVEEGDDVGSFGWDLELSPEELAERVKALARKMPVMTLADVAGVPVVEEAADTLPVAVPWLWPGRVPIGRPTVLLGGLDHGKSVTALNLAAWVSTGAEWPDGRGRAPKGKVVLMCREDNLGDTIRPRLDEAGADLEMIVVLDKVWRFNGSAEIRRDITLRDLADLERAIEIAGNVRLVVIDPLAAYFGRDTPSRRRVRAAMAGLTEIAGRHKLAVVVTAEGGGGASMGFGATQTLTSIARTAWLLAPDPAEPTRRMLLSLKSNLGDPGGGLACHIRGNSIEWEPAPVAGPAEVPDSSDPAAGLAAASRFAMSLPGVTTSALAMAGISRSGPSSALAVSLKRGPKPLCLETASQWLQDYLAAGPVEPGVSSPGPGTVRGDAEAAGLAWGTVQRAFQDLKGMGGKCPQTGKYVWRLPGSAGGEATPEAE